MYTNLNDDRFPNLTGEYEVFTFSGEEKETTLNYVYVDKLWYFYTNVPSHITKLIRLKGSEYKILTVNANGVVTSIEGKLSSKQVSFRNLQNALDND